MAPNDTQGVSSGGPAPSVCEADVDASPYPPPAADDQAPAFPVPAFVQPDSNQLPWANALYRLPFLFRAGESQQPPPPGSPEAMIRTALGFAPSFNDKGQTRITPFSSSFFGLSWGSTGQIEYMKRYRATVEEADTHLQTIDQIMQHASRGNASAEELASLDGLMAKYSEAAEMVRKVYTRGDLNDYSTIEHLSQIGWDRLRKMREAGQVCEETTIPIDATMIGFNLNNMNGLSRAAGTATILVLPQSADTVAKRWAADPTKGSPEAKLVGTWNNSTLIVSGIPEEKISQFTREVGAETVDFLSRPHNFPPEWVSRIGAENTQDIKIGQRWSVELLGLNTTHRLIEVPATDFRPPRDFGPGSKDKPVDLHSFDLCMSLAEGEEHAKLQQPNREGIRVSTGPIPDTSPAKGKGYRPILQNTNENYTFQPGESPPRPLTIEDIIRLPRPGNQGGRSIGYARDLGKLLATARREDGSYDPAKLRPIAEQVVAFTRTCRSELQKGFEGSFRDLRFPDIIRSEAVGTTISDHLAEGKKVVLVKFELKNFRGTNEAHPPGPEDPLLRSAANAIRKGFQEQGISGRVEVGVRGGDELVAILSFDGQTRFAPEELHRLIDQAEAGFNEQHVGTQAQLKVKVPQPGGAIDGQVYLVKDGKVYVTERPQNVAEFGAALRRSGFDIDVTQPGHLKVVRDFKKLGAKQRMNAWVCEDPETGAKLHAILPPDVSPPEGFRPEAIGMRATASTAVVLQPGDGEGLIPRALEIVDDAAMARKALVGPDRPLPKDATADFTWFEHMAARPNVRAGLRSVSGVGSFAVGSIIGGHLLFGDTKPLTQARTYVMMGADWGGGMLGHEGGNYLSRAAIERSWLLVRDSEGARVLDRPLMQKEYTGGRGGFVKVGGALGANIVLELLHRGGNFDPATVGTNTALMMGVGKAVDGAMAIGRTAAGALEARSEIQAARWVFAAGRAIPNPVTQLLRFAAECAILKAGGMIYERHVLAEEEGRLKGDYGTAILRLDRTLEETKRKFAAGSIDEKTAKENIGRDLKTVSDSFMAYLSFQVIFRTEEGTRYREARETLEERKQERVDARSQRDAVGESGSSGMSRVYEQQETAEAAVVKAEQEFKAAGDALAAVFKKQVEVTDGGNVPPLPSRRDIAPEENFADRIPNDPALAYQQFDRYMRDLATPAKGN